MKRSVTLGMGLFLKLKKSRKVKKKNSVDDWKGSKKA